MFGLNSKNWNHLIQNLIQGKNIYFFTFLFNIILDVLGSATIQENKSVVTMFAPSQLHGLTLFLKRFNPRHEKSWVYGPQSRTLAIKWGEVGASPCSAEVMSATYITHYHHFAFALLQQLSIILFRKTDLTTLQVHQILGWYHQSYLEWVW